MATVTHKACSLCKQILPASSFGISRKVSFGLQSGCKPCLAAQRRAKRNVDIDAFRAWQRDYYARNREHCQKVARDDYIKHRAVKNERSRAHYSDNRAKYIALAVKCAKDNPERTRLTARATQGKRRAAKEAGVSSLLYVAWVKAQKKVCHWCARRCASKYHVDHIIPLSKGGPHEIRNLCIACQACNLRKSAKDPIDWARELGKLL
jgi:5-methylcytosine-specific restriction endonuclease McrA